MGLRDALRSMRAGATTSRGEATTSTEELVAGDEATETWFQPRRDGSYEALLHPGTQLFLRFLPGWKVVESTTGEAVPVAEQQNPSRGEYTAAGRFNVQRRFERIITYTVLDIQQDGFVARRINAADRADAPELSFTFLPDQAIS